MRNSSFKSYHLMVNHRWDDPIKSVSWIINQAPVRGGTSGWADRQAGRVSGGHPDKSSCALLIREASHCSPLSTCHPLPNEHIQHRLTLSPACHLSLARRAGAGGHAAQMSHREAVINNHLWCRSDTHICLTGSEWTIEYRGGTSQWHLLADG